MGPEHMKYRFELKCLFDGTVFVWPPSEEPPLEGSSEDEALSSSAIICPGDPELMLPPHTEFFRGEPLEWRDFVEILNTYVESAEQ